MRGRWVRQYVVTLAGLAIVAAAVLLPLRALWSSRPEPTVSPSAPAASEVRLFTVPAGVLRACRRADSGASFPVRCPAQLPRRQEPCVVDGTSVPPGRTGCQAVARAVLLRSGTRVHGLEMGYSAPYEDQPELNRPTRFLHLVLLGGRASVDPEALGPSIGMRELGGQTGRLYRGRPGGLHHGHIVFVWSERGTRYSASLHGWDSTTETIALLDRLVEGLGSPGSLG
jgi:hypothetical protein